MAARKPIKFRGLAANPRRDHHPFLNLILFSLQSEASSQIPASDYAASVPMEHCVNRQRKGNTMYSEPYIYFLQGEFTGLIKIGFSSNPKRRLEVLSAGSSEPIRFLAVTRGDQDLENLLHQRFRDARVHGEWFLPTLKLTRFINGVCDSRIPATRRFFGAFPQCPAQASTKVPRPGAGSLRSVSINCLPEERRLEAQLRKQQRESMKKQSSHLAA